MGQGDRQHVAFTYSGILAAEIAVVTVTVGRTLQWAVGASPNRIEWALTGRWGPVPYSFRAERRTIGGVYLADVSRALIGGTIELNNDRDVCRSAEFDIDPDARDDSGNAITIDPLSDNLAVFMDLLVDGSVTVGLPMGLFVLVRPQSSFTPAREALTVEGYDVGFLLANQSTASTYTVASGTNYVTAMDAVVDQVSSSIRTAFPPTTLTTPTAMSWPPGTTWLRILTDLAGGINYYQPWADRDGILRSRQRDDLSQRTPDVTYRGGADGDWIVSEPIDQSQADIWVNQVIVVVDDPARAPASAVRTNADPSSPISTVVTGRTFTRVIQADRAADSTTLEAIADDYLRRAASAYQTATLTTSIDPRRDAHEVYLVDVDDVYDSVKWAVRNWSLDLVTGGRMQHELSRTASVVAS